MCEKYIVLASSRCYKIEWKIIIATLVLLFPFNFAWADEVTNNSTKVVNLTEGNFDEELDKKPHFVMFFDPK